MKKNSIKALASFAAFVFVIAAVSCSKEEDKIGPEELNSGENQEVVTPAKQQVTIMASIPEEGLVTKVELTQDGSNKKLIKLAWETGDTIDINGETFTIKDATISGDGHSAEFTGTDPGAGPYTIVYSDLPGSFTAQTQASDGDTDHLGYSVSLTGADDFEDVAFNSTWASAHGATLAQSSVLSLRALLPAGMAANVQKVIFKASEDVFNGGKTLEVTIGTPGDTDSDNLLKVYATLPAGDVVLAADMDLLVQFQVSANAYDKYTAYRKIDSGTTFVQSGSSQYLGINCSNIASYANASTTNIGESTNPYLIGDQHQLDYMHTAMISGTTYFKLVDDVDMTGVSWDTLLNPSNPYDKVVNIDGDNKTISNLGGTMFYVFKGSVQNLTLDNPTITAGNKKGAFAQFIQGINNTLTNLDVRNVSDFPASSGPCGGLIGLVNSGTEGETTATFEWCDVSNVVVNSNGSSAGGLIGSVEAKVVLTNCTRVGGTVTNNKDYAGGLIGNATAEVIITSCSVSKSGETGSVTGANYTGGLIGSMTKGIISKSNSSVNVTGSWYVGGLVGSANTADNVEVSECYYSTGTVSAARFCGGLVGYKEGESYGITVSDSYASGSFTSSNRVSGGILGNLYQGTASISNCFVSGAVSAPWAAGGLVGWVEVAGLTMTKCLAWNSSVTATSSDASEHYSSGAVIGYAKGVKVTLTSNYRKKSFSFTECPGNTANALTLNSGDKNNTTLGLTSSYIRPYHGKKETSETTVSGFANNAGIAWSALIWNTSTTTPTLINNPES